MALTLGSVSINMSTAAETKSGMCGSLYDQLKAAITPTESTDVAAKAEARRGLAALATPIATWLHTELTTNAKAKIATTDSALQRTPNPNNPDTATQGPSADKFVSIV